MPLKIPTKVLIALATIISTTVSLLAGFMLYNEAVKALEVVVDQGSHSEVSLLAGVLAQSFDVTQAGASILADSVRYNARKGAYKSTKDVVTHTFGHEWAYAKGTKDQRNSGSGFFLFPKNLTRVFHPPSKNAFDLPLLYTYVWWDSAVGATTADWNGQHEMVYEEEDPSNADGYVDGKWLGWAMPAYALEPKDGTQVGEVWLPEPLVGYWDYTSYEDGTGEWNAPSAWIREDGGVVLLVDFTYVFDLPPPDVPTPGGFTLAGTKAAIIMETSIAHWSWLVQGTHGATPFGGTGTFYVGNLQLDMILLHITCGGGNCTEQRAPPSEACKNEESHGYVHSCYPSTKLFDGSNGTSVVTRDTAAILNRTAWNATGMHKEEVGGEVYFFRKALVAAHPGASRPTLHYHACWYRPMSDVEDQVKDALIKMIIFVMIVFGFDVLLSIVHLFMLSFPLERIAKAFDYLALMQLEVAREHAIQASNNPFVVNSEVKKLQDGFKYSADVLEQMRSYMPQTLLTGLIDKDDEGESPPVSPGPKSPAVMSAAFSGATGSKVMSMGSAATSKVIPKDLDLMSGGTSVRNRAKIKQQMGIGGMSKKSISIYSFNMCDWHKTYEMLGKENGMQMHADLFDGLLTIFERERGVPDTFCGDRIVCTFNAVRTCSQHKTSSVRAAVTSRDQVAMAGQGGGKKGVMQGAGLKSIQSMRGMDDDGTLATTIGVASGNADVGTLGTTTMRRLSFITPHFTYAVALERTARQFGARILCSHSMYESVKSFFYFCTMDRVQFLKANSKVQWIYQPMYGISSNDEEWMYQLESTDSKDPFMEWNTQMNQYWGVKTGSDSVGSAEARSALSAQIAAWASDEKKAMTKMLLRSVSRTREMVAEAGEPKPLTITFH